MFLAGLYGLLAGVIGTGGGALVACFFNKNGKGIFALLSVSAGIMLSVTSFDLLPEAFSLAGPILVISGTLLGIAVLSICDNGMKSLSLKTRSPFVKMGILLCAGIAMHNFPEGLAIGSGYEVTASFGMGLCIILGLHDIPEGMAMALPLRAGGVAPWKIVLWALISGVPTGFGAIMGSAMAISNSAVALCLSLAAGAMLYLVFDEMLPQGNNKSMVSPYWLMGGFIIGIILTTVW